MSAQFICEFLTHLYVRRILIKFLNIYIFIYMNMLTRSSERIFNLMRYIYKHMYMLTRSSDYIYNPMRYTGFIWNATRLSDVI